MVHYVMSKNRKVVDCSTISPLDPSDYDVNLKNVRIKDLDNTIKGGIGDLHKFHK